jgi:hypothetical protein
MCTLGKVRVEDQTNPEKRPCEASPSLNCIVACTDNWCNEYPMTVIPD